MNDLEFDVVARNAILLLLALTSQDSTNPGETKDTSTPTDIAEALVHIWYSASIPSSVLSLLQNRVKPLIVELCGRIADKPLNTVSQNLAVLRGEDYPPRTEEEGLASTPRIL